MLYMAHGGRIERVHGPLVGDDEVEEVVRFLKTQGEPSYIDGITEEDEEGGFDALAAAAGSGGGEALYRQAVQLVCAERKASTSFVQRHLQIGYNRAARIIEQMEIDGMIGPQIGTRPREVFLHNLADDEE